MTIYNFDVDSDAMSGFPSARYILDMCKHICSHILVHLQEVVVWDQPDAQIELNNCKTILQWQLDLLKNATVNQITETCPIVVHHIYVHRRSLNVRSVYDKSCDLSTLSNVPSIILLEMFTKLLRDSVVTTLPIVRLLSAERLGMCARMLLSLADRVKLATNLESKSHPYFVAFCCNVEFCNEQEGVVYLAKTRQAHPAASRR